MQKEGIIFALLGVMIAAATGLVASGGGSRDTRAWTSNGGVPLSAIHTGFCADLEAKLVDGGLAVPDGGLTSCTIRHFECVRTCQAGTDGPCLLGSSWGMANFPVNNKPENKLGCYYQQPGLWDLMLLENGWKTRQPLPEASEMVIADGMTGYGTCEVAPAGTNGYVNDVEGSCVEAYIGMSRAAGTRLEFEPTCNGSPDDLSCTAWNATFCSVSGIDNADLVAIVVDLCPVMCDTCKWTTSTDTTSTSTTSITYTTTSQTGTTTTRTGTTTTITTTTGTTTTTTVTKSTTTVTGTTTTTTSGTTTTTSHTETTTTTLENCNGKYDPLYCEILGPEKCVDPKIGQVTREACRLMCDSCDETTSSSTATTSTATATTTTETTATSTTTTTIMVQMLKLIVSSADREFRNFEDMSGCTSTETCREFQTKLSAAVKDFIVDNSDLLMMEVASMTFDPAGSYSALLMPNLSQSDVAAALMKLSAVLTFSFPESGLVEQNLVVTAIEQGTATWVAPLCNGFPDPVDCHDEKASYCNNGEVGYLMQARCPVMCGTCIDTTTTTTTGSTTTLSTTTTTSTTSSSTTTVTDTSSTVTDTTTTGTTTTTTTETTTTTTTATSVTSTTTATTTTPTCNGKPDPDSCAEFFTCDSVIYGDKLMDQCPVLCGSCTSSSTTVTATTVTTKTATTTTSKTETTTTPVCNGLPDPALCKAQSADLCINDITSRQLQESCPVLCGSCVLTSSTTTKTVTTATETTKTRTSTTPTTTTSTTTTSTITTTTTTPTCHGLPDPEDCNEIPVGDCASNSFFGDTVKVDCPVLCNSCPTTTVTSTTTTTTTTSKTATTITTTTSSTSSSTTTTTTASTTTTTTPVCNGMPDPAGCAEERVDFCRNAITELPLATRCPVMCDACITTSSTTTMTGTTTTTTPSCNGAIDPPECSKFSMGQCTDSIYGDALIKDCPLLCNTCIPTTFTSTTTTTTVTTLTSTTSTTTSSTSTVTTVTETTTTPPNCNGNLDPPECTGFIRDDCRNVIIGADVRVGCPLLCDTCITTTLTTTTTTTTATSTTVTSTTGTTTTASSTTTTVTSTTVTSTTLSTTTTTYSTTTRSSTTKTTTSKTTTTTTKSTTSATETSTTTGTSTTQTTTSRTGTTTTVTSTTKTTTTETSSTTTATSTTTTPVCNGLPDPIQCKALIEREGLAICGNRIAGAPMDQKCPVSCGTCITTTSVTGTTTTTATTTTAIPECNGKKDPTLCSDVSPDSCVDTLSGPLLSAACPVLCGTCLSTPAPTEADCTADPNCKNCNSETGSCQRCKGFAYLYLGHCYESANDCSVRGLVPVGGQGGGKADSGYACVAYGGTCAYDTVQSCRPPKGLGDCLAAQINGPDEFKCTSCNEKSWLVDGICRKQRICKNGRFVKEGIMSDEECSCKTKNVDGSMNKDCKQCELRVAPPEFGGFFAQTIKGEFRECGVCTNHMLRFEGQCIAPGTCPEGLAEVSWKETLGSCEAPFSCKGGVKVGGDNDGKRCRCLENAVCSECNWGFDGHSCSICKKNTYLLDGSCVSRDVCIARGNFIPIQGDGPRGGRCIKLF